MTEANAYRSDQAEPVSPILDLILKCRSGGLEGAVQGSLRLPETSSEAADAVSQGEVKLWNNTSNGLSGGAATGLGLGTAA